jgi:pimeloyl-ACP methyl ester carboxylesterase
METVRSADGVAIAFERWGEGPPVVAVHGSDTTHRSWRPFAHHLDGQQVCAMDRRGRGESGDGDGYTFDREVTDVRAVVEAVAGDPSAGNSGEDRPTGDDGDRSSGDGVALVGHSFGALPAFEAARGSGHVSRLVLYEPPALCEHHRAFHAALVAEVERRVADGDTAGALRHFEREAAGVPEDVLARVDWERQVATAAQTRREIAAVAGYHAPAGSGITVPTLCLVGEHSPEYLHETTRALADAIPDSRVETLASEGHLATLTGPAKLADAVGSFLAVS